MTRKFADALRLKYPGTARKADHEGSRSSAIKLFCYECMGGSRDDVAECPARACFLWPYRPAGDTDEDRPVPTVEEYRAMTADRPAPTWIQDGSK